jgi:UDP-N-acetylglucosamine--N-acetylmuramyl-(pentapeptide) pyrophosphoryl-undecaprenol N-acetylglucosamine transferase
VLGASDLVLARSGGSLFEVTAAGRPAVLVPYPHATADHQTTNAAWMADAGAAEVVEDSGLSARLLLERIGGLLGDEARLATMSAASAALARPNAARAIANEVLSAASGAPYVGIDRKGRTGT